jgi:hypothetical protein
MSVASTAAAEVEQLKHQIQTLHQQALLEKKAERHAGRDNDGGRRATAINDGARSPWERSQEHKVEDAAAVASEPEAVLLAVSGNGDEQLQQQPEPEPAVAHEAVAAAGHGGEMPPITGSEIAQSGQQHQEGEEAEEGRGRRDARALAGVIPPRTPRRAALQTLSDAGWFQVLPSSVPSTAAATDSGLGGGNLSSTGSSFAQTMTIPAVRGGHVRVGARAGSGALQSMPMPAAVPMYDSEQLQVDLGALSSRFHSVPSTSDVAIRSVLRPQPPPRPNLPTGLGAHSRAFEPLPPPPAAATTFGRSLRMAPVAPAALPDRLQFPDYKLSQRTPITHPPTVASRRPVLHCPALPCTALYCAALHCCGSRPTELDTVAAHAVLRLLHRLRLLLAYVCVCVRARVYVCASQSRIPRTWIGAVRR